MSAVDDYIKENAEIHKFAAEVARIISGIPQMPDYVHCITAKSL